MRGTIGLGSGLVGATSVAVLNHLAGRYLPGDPRLDVLGMQLATVAFNKIGIGPPRGLPLKILALVGSLVSNSMFYTCGFAPPHRVAAGGALGPAMELALSAAYCV
jgi:hypothetical protein